jgi:hypothetical protein
MRNPYIQAFQDRTLHFAFRADPEAIKHLIPSRTEPLEWDGEALLGLSASLLSNVMYKGFRISGEDVVPRLAFYAYVRETDRSGKGSSTGAFLLEEAFPRKRNAWIARFLMGTEASVLRMDYEHRFGQDGLISQFFWERAEKWNSMKLGASKDMEGLEDSSMGPILAPDFFLLPKKGKFQKCRVEQKETKLHPVFDHQLRLDPDQLPIDRVSWKWDEPISAHSLEGTTVSVSKPYPIG